MELLKLLLAPEIIKAILGSAIVVKGGHWMFNRMKERSARLFKTSSRAYREVDTCVKQTNVDMVARRTTITEIHNGGVWLSNQPIYRITTTHEATREGVDKVGHFIQEQITTGVIMELLIDLDRDRVKYIADLQKDPNQDLCKELSRHGSRSVWMYMLKNKKGRPMGIFAVGFDRANIIETNELEMLMRRVHHIEELMQ